MSIIVLRAGESDGVRLEYSSKHNVYHVRLNGELYGSFTVGVDRSARKKARTLVNILLRQLNAEIEELD